MIIVKVGHGFSRSISDKQASDWRENPPAPETLSDDDCILLQVLQDTAVHS